MLTHLVKVTETRFLVSPAGPSVGRVMLNRPYKGNTVSHPTPGMPFQTREACGNLEIPVQHRFSSNTHQRTAAHTTRSCSRGDSVAVTAGRPAFTRPSAPTSMLLALRGTERENSHPLPAISVLYIHIFRNTPSGSSSTQQQQQQTRLCCCYRWYTQPFPSISSAPTINVDYYTRHVHPSNVWVPACTY